MPGPLARVRDDPGSAPLVLVVAMVVSALLTLWLGRDLTFSGDEAVWVAASPGMDLRPLFEPHGGHLLFLTRLIDWPILAVNGLGYMPFQMLALAAILLAVGPLFTYGRRLVGDWMALAPCLVLLFYGTDYLQLFQGNGFTVLIAMAFGIAALIAFQRGDRRGDVLVCIWPVREVPRPSDYLDGGDNDALLRLASALPGREPAQAVP